MASGGGETDGKYEYIRVLRPAPALPFLPPEDATAVYAGLQRTLKDRKKYSIFTFFCFVLPYESRDNTPDDPCPPVGNRHVKNTP